MYSESRTDHLSCWMHSESRTNHLSTVECTVSRGPIISELPADINSKLDLPAWVKNAAKMLNGGTEGRDWIALAKKLGTNLSVFCRTAGPWQPNTYPFLFSVSLCSYYPCASIAKEAQDIKVQQIPISADFVCQTCGRAKWRIGLYNHSRIHPQQHWHHRNRSITLPTAFWKKMSSNK